MTQILLKKLWMLVGTILENMCKFDHQEIYAYEISNLITNIPDEKHRLKTYIRAPLECLLHINVLQLV